MAPNILIRAATPDDISLIKQIADVTWPQTYASILSEEQISYMFNLAYTPEALHNQMMKENHQFLLLFYDQKASAFVSFSPLPEDRNTLKIHKIYLMPHLQGKGLGKMLLDEVFNEASNQKAERVSLNVNRYNPALHFYKKYGFKVAAEVDIPIGPYWMNDYVMEKQISL